ncbi:MAG: hypothetical protein NZM42_15270, partial [Gemmatales bacterium]|nr:hypothetical protein [Gemmatales bacterium]
YRSWVWDDENQLIRVEQYQSWKSELTYDGRQRLRVRKDYTWHAGNGQWQLASETRYVYDGLLIVQERNAGHVPQISYARGQDLSGTLEEAGGIGGLLARYRHSTSSPYAINGSSFYHADGNGNVTYLASSAGGTDAAYRYDPFGRWQAHTGSYAGANVMRFSSKPWLAHNGSATDGLY